jgi:hypothetical protein
MVAPKKPRKAPVPKVRLALVVKTRDTVDERDDNGEKTTRHFDVPEVAQAASLGLALLTEAGCDTWAEFAGESDEYREKAFKKVFITDEQADLLDKHPNVLTWLSRASSPAATIVVCPDCAQFSVTLGTTPSACRISPRCGGKPVRVTRAPREKKAAPAKTDGATDPDEEP